MDEAVEIRDHREPEVHPPMGLQTREEEVEVALTILLLVERVAVEL
jgi:hypothetical protein